MKALLCAGLLLLCSGCVVANALTNMMQDEDLGSLDDRLALVECLLVRETETGRRMAQHAGAPVHAQLPEDVGLHEHLVTLVPDHPFAAPSLTKYGCRFGSEIPKQLEPVLRRGLLEDDVVSFDALPPGRYVFLLLTQRHHTMGQSQHYYLGRLEVRARGGQVVSLERLTPHHGSVRSAVREAMLGEP